MQNVRHLKAQLWNSTSFISTGSYLNDSSSSLNLIRSDPTYGRFILGSNAADQLLLWDRFGIKSEDSLLIKPIAKNSQSNGKLSDICWYPYDQSMFVALCGPKGQGMIYETESFQPLVTIPLNYSAYCCQFCGNASMIAFGCKGMIRMFDFRSKSCISTIKTCPSEVTTLYWDDSFDNLIWYGNSVGTVGVADCRYLECMKEYGSRVENYTPTAILQLLNVNGQIYSIGVNGTLQCYPTSIEGEVIDFGILPINQGRSSWKEPKSMAVCSAFQPTNPSLLICNGDNGFGLWNIYEKQFVKQYRHSTLQCSFPFLEYNRHLEEVYLYNNSKIVAIFDRCAISTDTRTNKRIKL